jgi:cyclohexanone monooxygenase
MLEQQAEHIAYIISEAVARGATTVEPSREAQDEWFKTIRETSMDMSEFAVTCTPGYYNNEGGGGGEGIRSALGDYYMPGFYAFDELLSEWRAKGDLDGLVLGT